MESFSNINWKHVAVAVFPKLAVEAFGCFFFILTISLSVLTPGRPVPLAVGMMLSAIVFAGGEHFNPAVTFGIWLSGRKSLTSLWVVGRWIAQVAGAICGAVVTYALTGQSFMFRPGTSTIFQVMVSEVIFTFALVLVVLNVATTKAQAGNSYYGLSIGFTVMAGIVSMGSISGGAFNPAVATGISVVDALRPSKGSLGDIIYCALYWFSELLGGALAALAFRMINETTEYGQQPEELNASSSEAQKEGESSDRESAQADV